MIDSCQQIESFKNNLIYDINNSNLTIGCAYYIFKDIFINLEKEYYNTLEIEKKEDSSDTIVEEKLDTYKISNEEEKEEVFLEDETN